ncbi:NADH-quinone oxidoreductase subunit B family protein [Thermofilum pendens]|uniref:NADH ubiquinone oxidoreductase, 20 kDa subunit n=1 Tax=Thermofilum pendens (strain DSM 2475 / Hrk 5) TaxID=368408 RepID=A1RWL1_THEPD|nr:NADH-quinone oxidoreductase subunit NuoB [Thermofilum pendens]ABL77591.1 NADH ubiquinone oxidoreductase, 20 kDa subunit [Thermofilum pendens Hrk 5]
MSRLAKQKAYDALKRSVYLLRVDSGSCNGCDIEVFDALTPYFDVERLGVKLVLSPRMADVILVTGPVTRQFLPVLKATYEAAPKPCVVVACGACACGGGIWYDTYGTAGGVDKVIPVDVYIPGCPPRPHAILHGVAVALDILEQKVKRSETKADAESFKPALPSLEGAINSWELYRALKLELYKHLGYRIGYRVLCDLLRISKGSKDLDDFAAKAEKAVSEKYHDARITEAVRLSCLKLKEVVGR